MHIYNLHFTYIWYIAVYFRAFAWRINVALGGGYRQRESLNIRMYSALLRRYGHGDVLRILFTQSHHTFGVPILGGRGFGIATPAAFP